MKLSAASTNKRIIELKRRIKRRRLQRRKESLTSGDDRHVDDLFAMASLHNGTPFASMVHRSSSTCSPLHSLRSLLVDLLESENKQS